MRSVSRTRAKCTEIYYYILAIYSDLTKKMPFNHPKFAINLLLTLIYGVFTATHCAAFHVPLNHHVAPKLQRISQISVPSGTLIGVPGRKYSWNHPSLSSFSFSKKQQRQQQSSFSSSSSLQMGYLPPGGSNKDSLVSNVIFPILTVVATILFFLSPLGALFFAVTNSIFLLLILLPVILSIGFQAWQYFYTISAPCPNCGAPTRVLKDDDVGPNLCLNCGSLIRANLAKDGVELCNDPNDIFDESSRVSSFFDLFTRDMDTSAGTGGGAFYEETTIQRKTMENRQDRERRERTVIDVDATKDD